MSLTKDLQEIIDSGDVHALDIFIQGPPGLDLDQLDQALTQAIRKSNTNIIAAFFRHGAHLEAMANLYASTRGDAAVYEVMLNNGWDINTTITGSPPILHALKDKDLLHWFLDNGADPHIPSVKLRNRFRLNLTPLELSAIMNDTVALEILLSRGAKMERNALFCTISKKNASVSLVPNVKILLDFGADIDYVWEYGTALHYAVYFTKKAILQYLLERGADRRVRDPFGMTPGELAEKRGCMDLFRILEEGDKV